MFVLPLSQRVSNSISIISGNSEQSLWTWRWWRRHHHRQHNDTTTIQAQKSNAINVWTFYIFISAVGSIGRLTRPFARSFWLTDWLPSRRVVVVAVAEDGGVVSVHWSGATIGRSKESPLIELTRRVLFGRWVTKVLYILIIIIIIINRDKETVRCSDDDDKIIVLRMKSKAKLLCSSVSSSVC